MLPGRGRAVSCLALELEFTVVKMIEPGSVRRMENHSVRQKIAHVGAACEEYEESSEAHRPRLGLRGERE